MTAFITEERKAPSSRAFTPSIVEPAGEHTASLSSPGCFPVSSCSLADPSSIWEARAVAVLLGRPQATPPSASASMKRSAKAGPQPEIAEAASISF